jgi:hypothetical protein
MSTTVTMSMRVHFRWWFKLWLYAVVIIEHFTGWAPSAGAFDWWTRRGTRLEVVS